MLFRLNDSGLTTADFSTNKNGEPDLTSPPSLLKMVGRHGFEPWKSKLNRFTVCPLWPLGYLPVLHM